MPAVFPGLVAYLAPLNVVSINSQIEPEPQMKSPTGPISAWMEHNFRHFNARETLDAARTYRDFVAANGKMLVSLAGAMSSAELGVSLAEMIRRDQVHAISCTAANLEEDVFNLVAHNDYKMVPNYRDLSPQGELALRDEGFNRVTDTCIPETVIRHLEDPFINTCAQLALDGKSMFPCEVFFSMFESGVLEPHFQVPVKDSWLYAAWKKGIPVYSPGFEDSTLGNIFAARVIDKTISSHSAVKSGTAQMEQLVNWYLKTDADSNGIGFFQIGGGIAGDFAICAVPLILQDLELRETRLWQYFAQISDSTTSYGSYSGAVPNEKITWYKLDVDAPKFMINSDASIIAPLVFAYVLGH